MKKTRVYALPIKDINGVMTDEEFQAQAADYGLSWDLFDFQNQFNSEGGLPSGAAKALSLFWLGGQALYNIRFIDINY